MSFLAKVKHHVPHVADRRGVAGYLVDKGERYAAAAGFGYLKGAYREKASVRGLPVDLLSGAALTLLAVGLEVWSGGRSALAPHMNAVGDAGLMSYFGSLGAAYGVKTSGRKVYVLDKGAKPPASLPPGMTAVAGIPQAVGGAYLSPEEVAAFTSQR